MNEPLPRAILICLKDADAKFLPSSSLPVSPSYKCGSSCLKLSLIPRAAYREKVYLTCVNIFKLW